MGHIEHHTLQPRDHVGTIGEDAVGLALVESGGILVVLLHVERQMLGLLTFYQSAGGLQPVDIGLQLLCEGVVVDAQDRCGVIVVF